MGKKVFVECTLNWAKLQERDRDMGKNDGSDVSNKLQEIQGQYVVDCVIDQAAKDKMIAEGIPSKGLQAQLFKEYPDGTMYYKAKRGHFNPKFRDPDGTPGVVVGPPKVIKETEDGYADWDWETDGLIGNGTKAEVKFDVWDGKITLLETVCITELVPYVRKDKF
jgi:hypothetical protein